MSPARDPDQCWLERRFDPLLCIAVDKLHEYGTPFFIDANLPIESAKPTSAFRRLMIAQDTGSAIVGPARADLYLGAGDDAARIAGRIRHPGRFVMLLPRELDMIAAGKQTPLPVPKPKLSELVEARKPPPRDCASGSGMDCGHKSISAEHLPATGRRPAGSNQEQLRQQQLRQQPSPGMQGRGRDQQQLVTLGRGPQQKRAAETTERRLPRQKQPPPATEGRGG